MERGTTSGLTAQQLVKLLALAAENEPIGEDLPPERATANELKGRLAGTLPLSTDVADSLPVILGYLSRTLLPLSGKPLSEVLLDPHAELAHLEAIKEHGKQLAINEGPPEKQASAIAIYYAAIASALVHHDKKITRHSCSSLKESFDLLARKPWMPAELVRLFSKARKLCNTVEQD